MWNKSPCLPFRKWSLHIIFPFFVYSSASASWIVTKDIPVMFESDMDITGWLDSTPVLLCFTDHKSYQKSWISWPYSIWILSPQWDDPLNHLGVQFQWTKNVDRCCHSTQRAPYSCLRGSNPTVLPMQNILITCIW